MPAMEDATTNPSPSPSTPAANTRKTGARNAMATRFWGRTAGLGKAVRIAALGFVIASIISISFTQLGFWSVGNIEGMSVYVILLLGPLAMGALLFGPRTGTALGLIAGTTVFLHATFFPLDYYEVYFMSPLNSFALMSALGAAGGWLFERALASDPQGPARYLRIILVCAALSAAASSLTIVNAAIAYGGTDAESISFILEAILGFSLLGAVAQAVIDLTLMVVLCLAADAIVQHLCKTAMQRTLHEVFRNWMLLTSAIVFMVVSAFIYTMATMQSQTTAESSMRGEVEYLQTQLAVAGTEPADLLDGYDVASDGIVIITDEGSHILATDEAERYGVGTSFLETIGEVDDPEIAEYTMQYMCELGSTTVNAIDDNGEMTLEFAFIAAGTYDGGYVVIMRDADMVYAPRLAIMASSALLALTLIAAIALLATTLLNRVVVRRIDETNDSLEKITDGDLNERVTVDDTREFASLSRGINTTVGALKDSIAEAEQRNARELAAAKAIQESALPNEFPPFPEIDRFDIYANMKTAKEVGGDFYDFFLLDDDRLGVVMADVSGKGIPAALFMMTAKTQIRNYMESGLPIDEAVNAANHQLCIGNDAAMFVTAFACVLDYRTGMLRYVNAGHNPPLLLHGSAWEWMKEKSGMPLGLFDGIPYTAHERQLDEHDMLYLYTDGVTEAMNVEDELFGEERLESLLRGFTALNPRSVCIGVRRALGDFTQGAEQSDDITMLALKYAVPPEKKALMVLPADSRQLAHVCDFIHEELHRRRAPKSVWGPIDIAAEELFVNVCHYAYPDATPENPGEVRISYEYASNPPALTVEIADDGIAYNPLAKPDATLPDTVEDMTIGGLGIFMAKQSVDDMAYRREGGSNILTFRKEW